MGCVRCGAALKPSKGYKPRKFCSKYCARKTREAKPKTGFCETCSSPTTNLRFCSRPCFINYRPPTKPCGICGVETTNVSFCSKECSFKNQLKLGVMGGKGPNAGNWNPDRTAIRRRRALKFFCYSFVRNSLGRVATDPDKIIPELGWTPQQAVDHIEKQFQSGMTWENHSRTGWHIDHIRPISSFPEGTPLSVINALSNLRPLWAKDNLSKGSKWNERQAVQP